MQKCVTILCTFFTWLLYENSYSQGKDEYSISLKYNREAINPDSANEYKLFDKVFYNNQFFFVGEFHGTKYSYTIAFDILQRIKQKKNIRYFIAELDNSSAQFINEYLSSGNNSILDSLFTKYKGTFFYSLEYRQLFIQIRELNKTLPANEKIKVIGVDIQHQPTIALLHIKQIIKQHDYKPDTLNVLDSFITKINQADYVPSLKPLYADAKAVLTEIDANTKEYKAIFKEDFPVLHYTFNNICNWAYVYMNRNNFDKLRDSIMADNFKLLTKRYKIKGETFFGYFGREHVFQNPTKDNKWFVSRIKENELTKQGIVSIILFYTGCEQMLPAQRLKKANSEAPLYTIQKYINDDGPFIKTTGIKILKDAAYPANSAITMFKLNDKQPPFSSAGILISNPLPDKKTTDYFQYAVLIKDSPATIPISNK